MNLSTPFDLTTYSQAIVPTTQQSVQGSSNQQIESTSNTLGGFFIIFLFVSYICVGLNYKKCREERKASQLRQVKKLEKIWKMPAYYKKD